MPFAASPSANICRLLFAPGRIGEFPLRSVGPDPAMMTTAGIGVGDAGMSSVPAIFPDGVSSVTGSPAPAGVCALAFVAFMLFATQMRVAAAMDVGRRRAGIDDTRMRAVGLQRRKVATMVQLCQPRRR